MVRFLLNAWRADSTGRCRSPEAGIRFLCPVSLDCGDRLRLSKDVTIRGAGTLTIGREAIVAARAAVIRDVPEYAVVGGASAQVIGMLPG